MKPVEILGLQVEPTSGTPIVLLREADDPHRVLPVFIGAPEAVAIAVGLEGASTSRPLTHDLLVDVLDGIDTHLERVDVTELVGGTFHAEIELRGPEGSRRVASRPSDAIALAVRVDAPVFASEDVLDAAGVTVTEVPDEEEIDATVEEFGSFLDAVDPADFALPPADDAPENALPPADDAPENALPPADDAPENALPPADDAPVSDDAASDDAASDDEGGSPGDGGDSP